MKPDKKSLVLPIVLVAVGVGWLLSTLGYVPSIDWIWTIGLGAVGLLTFVVGGFDKFTVVVGSFFLLASITSVLRQTGKLPINIEAPMIVIAIGLLMLVARSPKIPMPKWLLEDSTKDQA